MSVSQSRSVGREGGASGIADDDKVIAAASAILEAKKKGRDTIPFDLALEMTGDPDKAYEALGLAFRKFALDQQESDALAREKAKQKEVDPAKAEAKEVIKESLAAQGQSGDDFLDSIEIDFNLNDLFGSRIQKEAKESEKETNKFLDGLLNIFKGRADVTRRPLTATEQAAQSGSRITKVTPIKKEDMKPSNRPEAEEAAPKAAEVVGDVTEPKVTTLPLGQQFKFDYNHGS